MTAIPVGNRVASGVNPRVRGTTPVVILLVCMEILAAMCGCSRPPVPQKLIEDLTIASVILDEQFLRDHMLGSSNGSPELDLFPASEIDVLRQMLKANYSSAVSYRGDKATVLVDISNSGIIEWFNVNKLKTRPDAFFDVKRYRVLCLQYSKGRWFYCDDRGISQGPLKGWPDIPKIPTSEGGESQ